MYYWARDIRADKPNEVKDAPVPWQHVSVYGLSIGAQGNIFYPNGIDAITAGVNTVTAPAPQLVNWPVAAGTGGPDSIDDLWHAAVNSRGQYFNAQNPQELAENIVSALADFTDPKGTDAVLGVAAAQLSISNQHGYKVSYKKGLWGDVEKYALNITTGVLPVDADGNPLNAPVWSAATKLDEQAAVVGSVLGWDTRRRIVTMNSESMSASEICRPRSSHRSTPGGVSSRLRPPRRPC
jgi:type IV pilus assembly protein PilY1